MSLVLVFDNLVKFAKKQARLLRLGRLHDCESTAFRKCCVSAVIPILIFFSLAPDKYPSYDKKKNSRTNKILTKTKHFLTMKTKLKLAKTLWNLTELKT